VNERLKIPKRRLKNANKQIPKSRMRMNVEERKTKHQPKEGR
jgi:hypothetical protein